MAHWWIRIGQYRDQAAGKIKVPIDYGILVFGGVASGVGSIPLWVTVSAYILTFCCYAVIGWHIMNRWHLSEYESEWLLKYNKPMRDVHKEIVENGNKKKNHT